MNTNFSFKRFALLFKKHTLEHGRTYLMSAAVLAGVLLIALGFMAYVSRGDFNPSRQAIIYVIFLLFAGSIFTSLIFADLGEKKKAIPVLSLPASHFEKYLVGWLYSFVVFQVMYAVVFYFADSVVISLSTPPPGGKINILNIFDAQQKVYYGNVAYALFGAMTLCGAIWFEKLHFIKTAFFFFIFMIVLSFFNQQILQAMIGRSVYKDIPFGWLHFDENGKSFSLGPGFDYTTVNFIVIAAVSLLFWVAAYYRLKEKEV